MSDHPDNVSSEALELRRRWFEWYADKVCNRSVYEPPEDGVTYRCPCCGYKTLNERGGYDICPVCFWEDDGQDDHDADVVRGGPNGSISLTEARANYQKFGASLERLIEHVRPPEPDEM